MQNSLEGEIGTKIAPYINPVYIPPPKPPNIQNTEGESIWVLEKESSSYVESVYRPPKPPDIAKFSRILLDFDMDLDMDYSHRKD